MRRPVLLSSIFVLATLTSGILVYAATAVTAELPTAERQRLATTNQDVVRAFYAVVNDVLRLGDAARLDELVPPDAVLRPASERQPWTENEFGGFLMALRDAYPDLQLTEEELLVDGDRVVARVSARATTRGPSTAFQRNGPPLSWEAIDVFHLTSGIIVDYSNHWPNLEIPQPLWEVSLDELPNPSIIAMLRFTYPRDTTAPAFSAPGPTLLTVETGQLAVTVYGAARLIQDSDSHDGPTPHSTLVAGSTALLDPGDLLVVPSGVSRSIRNDSPTPTVVLEFAAFPYDPLAWVFDAKIPMISRVLAMYSAPGEFTSSVMWPAGVTVQALFDPEVVPLPSRAVTLTVGYMTLGTDDSITAHDAGWGEFFYVESGNLELTAMSEAMRITRAAGVFSASYVETIVSITTRPHAEPWLLAGDAVFVAEGTVPAIQSLDSDPVTLVVLRISPDDE